ncbi:hypothetical protein HW555_009196 [Spodoptera exigua]|uniref:Uncharacterized protein n=1 Tax=Spodoptera exigua TaxID=7107 RepID=A0A835GBJ3_SPOEX|nr:hypothetical protein HW555_009196 [Spodoptera exigua]
MTDSCEHSFIGWTLGETGLNVHSKESESGVPGVEGVSLSEVHIRLESGESASSQRRLPDSMFGRLTGLKLDARIAMGDKLRRVVYFRVGEGDTTGVLVGELANPATSVRSSQDWPICMAVCISLSCATSRVLLTSAHSSARSWLTRGAIRAHEFCATNNHLIEGDGQNRGHCKTMPTHKWVRFNIQVPHLKTPQNLHITVNSLYDELIRNLYLYQLGRHSM